MRGGRNSSPSGGQGGASGDACQTGTSALCSCLAATASPCSTTDVASFQDGCTTNSAAYSFVRCYAGFVSGTQVACGSAASACLPTGTAGAPGSGGSAGAGGAPSCSPGTGTCSACIANKCCAEFTACSGDAACGGSNGELTCVQTCLINQIQTVGVGDVAACGASCASGAVLSEATSTLVACMIATGSSGTENCAVECFGTAI